MQRRRVLISMLLACLVGPGIGISELPAQEKRQVTDLRERSAYSAEELGAALFPTTDAALRTRSIMVRAPQSPPAALLQSASVVLPILFGTNSTEILPQYYADLDKLGAQLTAPHYKEHRVQIEGHTDNQGSEQYNRLLSERRAESVRQYLVQRFALAPERLLVKGYGKDRPLVPNLNEENRRKNRRIEIANVLP